MYPAGQLACLAWRKAELQARIAEHRADCADAFVELAKPLNQIDRWRARLSALRFIWPVGAALWMAKRKGRAALDAGEGAPRRWMRWLPVAVRVARFATRF